MSSPSPHGDLGAAFCPEMGETLLALILSRAGELPQPPASHISWPIQPQCPAAQCSCIIEEGQERGKLLRAIKWQCWVFRVFIFLQGLACHGAVVLDLHAVPIPGLTLPLALSQWIHQRAWEGQVTGYVSETAGEAAAGGGSEGLHGLDHPCWGHGQWPGQGRRYQLFLVKNP